MYKENKELVRRKRFFRSMDAIFDRFYKGTDIDLAQLEEFSKAGKIEKVIQINSSVKELLSPLKQLPLFNGHLTEIFLIAADVRGRVLIQLLEQDPLRSLGQAKRGSDSELLVFVNKYVASDKDIFKRGVSSGGKRTRFPAVWGYYTDEDNDPVLLKYSAPVGSAGGSSRPYVGFFRIRHARMSIPQYFSANDLIITGR